MKANGKTTEVKPIITSATTSTEIPQNWLNNASATNWNGIPSTAFSGNIVYNAQGQPIITSTPTKVTNVTADVKQTTSKASTKRKASNSKTTVAPTIEPTSDDFSDDDLGDYETKGGKSSRLEKNREAAQLFRQRQKAYLDELETRVDVLATENADSKAKLELLNSENKLVKEQLSNLRAFIGQALSIVGAVNPSVMNNAPQTPGFTPAQPTPPPALPISIPDLSNPQHLAALAQMLPPQFQAQIMQMLNPQSPGSPLSFDFSQFSMSNIEGNNNPGNNNNQQEDYQDIADTNTDSFLNDEPTSII